MRKGWRRIRSRCKRHEARSFNGEGEKGVWEVGEKNSNMKKPSTCGRKKRERGKSWKPACDRLKRRVWDKVTDTWVGGNEGRFTEASRKG